MWDTGATFLKFGAASLKIISDYENRLYFSEKWLQISGKWLQISEK